MKVWIVYYSEAYYISVFFTVKLRLSIFFTKDLIKLHLSTHAKQTLALSSLQYECSVEIILLLVFSQLQSILILSFEQFSVGVN